MSKTIERYKYISFVNRVYDKAIRNLRFIITTMKQQGSDLHLVDLELTNQETSPKASLTYHHTDDRITMAIYPTNPILQIREVHYEAKSNTSNVILRSILKQILHYKHHEFTLFGLSDSREVDELVKILKGGYEPELKNPFTKKED